jgi:hypothetical protein
MHCVRRKKSRKILINLFGNHFGFLKNKGFQFPFFSTHAMYIQSMLHNSMARLPRRTLAGFEPGSSVPEADVMSTAARHAAIHFGMCCYFI